MEGRLADQAAIQGGGLPESKQHCAALEWRASMMECEGADLELRVPVARLARALGSLWSSAHVRRPARGHRSLAPPRARAIPSLHGATLRVAVP
eukprot:610168-Rhodomonas_salina.5